MCITANKHVHALKSWKEVPNGWKFTGIQISSQTSPQGSSRCSTDKNVWFGFCNNVCLKPYPLGSPNQGMCCNSCWANGCEGTIKTTLRMCGKVRLKFGNCNNHGYVVAKLNGKQVGRANPYESKTIVFAFKDGDILELTDMGQSMIELYLNELNIISCSTC